MRLHDAEGAVSAAAIRAGVPRAIAGDRFDAIRIGIEEKPIDSLPRAVRREDRRPALRRVRDDMRHRAAAFAEEHA